MKNFKKLMALVIAAVMVVGSMNAFAATTTGGRDVDTEISISGLDAGDTVKLYKVVGWSDSVGWVVETAFEGISIESDIEANNPVTIDTGVMNEINTKVNGAAAVNGNGGQPTNGTYTYTVPEGEEGMYIAIVTPATAGTVYSPIIVSADYDPTSPTTIDASNSSIQASSGLTSAVAKKSTITLDKEAENTNNHDYNNNDTSKPLDDETVTVGDTLTFTVETQIPPFAGYLDPSFVLTDVMTSGLKYTTGSVTLVEPTGAQYTVSDETDAGYKITLTPSYLKTIATATTFKYTYTATVTTDAVKSVNPENNTITLEYNNNPNDSTSKTKLRDRTNHYTFTIDGNLLGQNNYSATEVVKIGMSADGVTEITKTTQLANEEWIGALQGAKFSLYAVDSFDNLDSFDPENATVYSNKDSAGNTVTYNNITSGSDGRFTIKGIDGGKYVLVETQAPAGYIKRNTPVTIEIIPTINENVTYEEDAEGVTVKVTTKELVSYVVKIDGVTTASYTITNSADPDEASSTAGDTVVGTDDNSGKIKNTQGVELPSTGGMGTTLFYTIGAILVLGAGILLVSKRRMSAN